MDQSEQTWSGGHVPLVLGGEWCGGEVQTHTCEQRKQRLTLLCSMPGQTGFGLFADLMISTCMSHSEQVTVGGLGLVDYRDVNDGCEDGTIKRPAEGGVLK